MKNIFYKIKDLDISELFSLKHKTVFFFVLSLAANVLVSLLVSLSCIRRILSAQKEHLSLGFSGIYLPLLLSGVLLLILAAASGLLFYKTVYQPIFKIDEALHKIMDVDPNYEITVSRQSELYPVAKSLNQILLRLKGYMDREYSEKILRKQMEIKALQSQINPHFLYNSLDCIRGEALMQNAPNIAHMTKALSNLFRYSMSHDSSLVTLRAELEHVNNYMIVQQYRFNNKFTMHQQIERTAGFNLMDYKLPRMTLQPIVENAIIHGLETRLKPGNIWISAYATSQRVVITIEDDGIGLSQEKMNELNESFTRPVSQSIEQEEDYVPKSIALPNINERIKLTYGDEFGLQIAGTLQLGTNVEITLPAPKSNMEFTGGIYENRTSAGRSYHKIL